ncbi:hypothetical protein LQ384_28170 [Rhodococcus rhodochrous]|uniref:Uncharacterized protein n=1 Tax=Rhodococcus rhodochrous TaxID=1829 RepID=A0AAW4XPJ6_RHORH|nr:hypothetical protein [Rhodococcus rhodochrous]MCD2114958.1 hypothetical protein [Rhodococcus rhodochrous]
MTGRVLVGMSIREVNAIRELEAAAAGADARLAFLQNAEPALSTVLTELADRGVTRIEWLGVCFGRWPPACRGCDGSPRTGGASAAPRHRMS